MKKILWFLSLFICFAPVKKSRAQLNPTQNVNHQTTLITAINQGPKHITIEADFVQMLTGKAAVAAAKKTVKRNLILIQRETRPGMYLMIITFLTSVRRHEN